MPDTKRTTASRRSHRWEAWSLSFWIFGGSALAVFVILAADPPPGGASEWLAPAVVVAGGSLSGLLAPRTTSTRGLIAALLIPIPILAVLGVVGAGLSPTPDDLPEVSGTLAIALLLFDIPMVVAFGVQAARAARRGEVLFAPVSNPDEHEHERNRELDRATNHGRTTTVVRDYIDDDEGQAHLKADTEALEARGYEIVSATHKPAPSRIQSLARLLLGLLLGGDVGDDSPHVVATFRLRSAGWPGR